MTVSPEDLKARISEMYPEIGRYSVDSDLSFDSAKNAWVLKLVKGDNELSTHIEPKDAEDCLQGIKCVYLGHQIGQFIEAYCLRGDACRSS